MIRVHREPLVPLFLFDLLPVPGRGEERNDNARTSPTVADERDRKSTRLNSSHGYISYAVFCLKKKNMNGLGGMSADDSGTAPSASFVASSISFTVCVCAGVDASSSGMLDAGFTDHEALPNMNL